MKTIFSKLIYVSMLGISLAACSSSDTTQPKRADIVDAVFASGYIITDQEYQVTANAEGYLIKSFVDEGINVEAGMPLFQLSNEVQSENVTNAQENYQDALRKLNTNSPERVQLELQIEQAKLQMELDKKNYLRYQKLLASTAGSQMDFDKIKLQYENSVRNVTIQEKVLVDLVNSLELNAKNAKIQLNIQEENNSDYFLSSAISGKVLTVLKQPGELIRRGEVVAVIGGGAKLAKLYVSEEDIQEIAIDQEVVISLNTEEKGIRKAKITKIYPSFDDVEQSFIVEASFKESASNIYHNTQLQANIIIGHKDDALVIPAQFLFDGDSVRIKGGDLHFVQTGLKNDQWVEIISGIDELVILHKPSAL